ENSAAEVTYFDPNLDKRIDGVDAMKKYLAPITGVIKNGQYQVVEPKVQHYGDAAVLSYILDGSAEVANTRQGRKWNVTEVYAYTGGSWKVIHSHFSYLKPELKN